MNDFLEFAVWHFGIWSWPDAVLYVGAWLTLMLR